MDSVHLFSPLVLRGLTLKNRIAVSPMCQYSSADGFANDWHFVHLGSRAVGGAAVVFTEATAVTAVGRISPHDLGIWSDKHVEFLSRISEFVSAQGAIPGMQLAHAGRKASISRPWEGDKMISIAEGGWQPVGPSPIPFSNTYPMPSEMSLAQIGDFIDSFILATKRALKAGFKIIEIHSAHGYLLHEFLSPMSNQRQDKYGGSFENRIRLLLEVTEAVRNILSDELPLFVRISCTDWIEGGWSIDDSVELSKRLTQKGVDLIDCSSGGNVDKAEIPNGPGYQTKFATRIREEANIATGALGFITSPTQADHIIRTGQADMVLLGREMLRDPYWPLRAGKELGHEAQWPCQYLRAAPHPRRG